jgi:PTS system fructose-specific IIC component
MKITELLSKKSIELNGASTSKDEVLHQLVNLMSRQGNIIDTKVYLDAVFAREAEGSTGVGEGVAIPHAKTPAVQKAGLAFMRCPAGVEFDSLDGQPAKIFFLIAAPNTKDNVHLDVLSRLSTLLMEPAFIDQLMQVKTTEELFAAISAAETAKFGAPKAEITGAQIVAVTACPTGIAHTYMAAESLEQSAAAKGITIKVETNGSSGVKNTLTAEDIAAAKGVIVAADKAVPMARFNGKKLLLVKAADGINKADSLIDKILNGDAPIFSSTETAAKEENAASEENAVRKIYKHLMNGVSHMLPFVIGGGILIALAFLFDMQAAGTAKFGSSTPLPAFLKNIGGLAFGLMMPVLAAYIAMSIADRPGLMLGFLAGLLANAGGSGFFGALIGGFVAGYLILGLKKAFSVLPSSLEGMKPVLLYPVVGLLLIGIIMTYIINPPTSLFNTWLTNTLNGLGTGSKLVMGFILGAMMSIDFGGPINKAAYVFGTASLASAAGQAVSSPFMASVMIGGMTPPISIAIATLLFKNKFTTREQASGLTNFIMGLCFITEGAIPFAASDPVRVIPTCALGSGIAGAISMMGNCSVPAPHGGIFVFGVVQNWPMYIVALLVGSVISALLMGLLKSKVEA